MYRVELNREQVRQLLDSWQNAGADSIEKKLIEDLFLITETGPTPGIDRFDGKPAAG